MREQEIASEFLGQFGFTPRPIESMVDELSGKIKSYHHSQLQQIIGEVNSDDLNKIIMDILEETDWQEADAMVIAGMIQEQILSILKQHIEQ